MLGLERQSLEDEEVLGALRQVYAFVRHASLLLLQKKTIT
jgi:hypothetical protein